MIMLGKTTKRLKSLWQLVTHRQMDLKRLNQSEIIQPLLEGPQHV